MMTRRGIFYDLENTLYKTEIDGVVYYFSSKNHLMKFKEKLFENRQRINDSLTGRFNIAIQETILPDIILYKKIESRGFLISVGGELICQESLVYGGGIVTGKI